MKVTLDISHNILDQFAEQLSFEIVEDSITMQSDWGNGSIRFYSINPKLELYHFQFCLKSSLSMQSQNPAESDWLLLNINLSPIPYEKKVNDKEVSFHKHLPTGMLFYTRNTKVKSETPIGQDLEIALLRFHRSLFEDYGYQISEALLEANIFFQHLSPKMERHLMDGLDQKTSPMIRHAYLLSFLELFVENLLQRETMVSQHKVAPADLRLLFQAAAVLRDPVALELPGIKDLSAMIGMSETKFKVGFKQVFGVPPMRYHNAIKMEYAKEVLVNGTLNVSELSYHLGYSHPSKFTRSYQRFFGKVPSQDVPRN